ncbi:DUF4136 domain-containing protein [Sulfurimonas sp.]|uniref:DUF4136 domain-containing protein n=1 Tax=Sulfurimonas sp. TaxID=2022749 RepID=UPI002AAF1C04|nr:DUF4136 domain-containing protein [Sulfurimonas sp.]
MKKITVLFIGLFLLVGCSTLKINVDYDESFAFKDKNSFVIKHKDKAGDDTLTNDRIINSLIADLKSKNYKKVSQNEADLIFVFHTSVKDKMELQTDYNTMGFGRYRFGGGMTTTTTSYNYVEGTLIIDALNPKNEKIVWRVVGTMEIKGIKSPKEKEEKINKLILKLMKKFPIHKN